MKEAHGTDYIAEAARSHGAVLLLAACHKWVFVGVTAPAAPYSGVVNHSAE